MFQLLRKPKKGQKKTHYQTEFIQFLARKKKKIVKFSARLAHDLLLLHTKWSFFVNKQKHVAACVKNLSLCAKCANSFQKKKKKKKKKNKKKKRKSYR